MYNQWVCVYEDGGQEKRIYVWGKNVNGAYKSAIRRLKYMYNGEVKHCRLYLEGW